MIKSGKQFTFDLDTNKLKEVLGEKGYTKAYNELYDYFCNDRGFEHRQGSVYCTHKLMNDYDVWKMSCELQKECPWITSALTRMDVTNIITHKEKKGIGKIIKVLFTFICYLIDLTLANIF